MFQSSTQTGLMMLAEASGSVIASWVAISMALFIIFANKRRDSAPCRRSGWGKFAVLVLVGIMTLLAFRFFAKIRNIEPARVAKMEYPDATARNAARLELEQRDRVRELERAQTMAANELAKEMSMQQLWEKLYTPRIKLDGNAGGVTMSAGNGPAPLAITAIGGPSIAAPPAERSLESLSASLARLERVVAQATAVADRVSEAGTLMGRAMIALNDTIDSRSRAAGTVKTSAKVITAAVELPKDTITKATESSERIVEIRFDAGKMNEVGISFDKARSILGHDGYWRGNTVRFDPQGQQVAVTGKIEPEYESRLANTLLGTSPKSGQVIHVRDVATIAPNPATIEIGVVDSNGKNASRPAWVDMPPKRIGNTWREAVASGEYTTKEECERASDIYLLLATYNHLLQLTDQTPPLSNGWRPDLKFDGNIVTADGELLIADGRARDVRLQELARYGIGIDFVRREIAKDQYLETVERSFGPMTNQYTLVEFTPSVDAELSRRWNERRRDERLLAVGAGAGSVLGLIGLAFGLLKVDTWTKGYYSKRLFLGVPAAIIGMLALLSLFGV